MIKKQDIVRVCVEVARRAKHESLIESPEGGLDFTQDSDEPNHAALKSSHDILDDVPHTVKQSLADIGGHHIQWHAPQISEHVPKELYACLEQKHAMLKQEHEALKQKYLILTTGDARRTQAIPPCAQEAGHYSCAKEHKAPTLRSSLQQTLNDMYGSLKYDANAVNQKLTSGSASPTARSTLKQLYDDLKLLYDVMAVVSNAPDVTAPKTRSRKDSSGFVGASPPCSVLPFTAPGNKVSSDSGAFAEVHPSESASSNNSYTSLPAQDTLDHMQAMEDYDENELDIDSFLPKQYVRSWEYPLSKSEKHLLYTRLCEQERAAVAHDFNRLLRRFSMLKKRSDSNFSESGNEDSESEHSFEDAGA
jgi:hypothetical protein